MRPVTARQQNIAEEPSALAPQQLAVRVPEAARLLGIGRSKCYELIRRGVLPHIYVGHTVRVPLGPLHDWVERQAATPREPAERYERKRNGQKNPR